MVCVVSGVVGNVELTPLSILVQFQVACEVNHLPHTLLSGLALEQLCVCGWESSFEAQAGSRECAPRAPMLLPSFESCLGSSPACLV